MLQEWAEEHSLLLWHTGACRSEWPHKIQMPTIQKQVIPRINSMTTFSQVIRRNDEAVNQMLQGDINVAGRNLRECFILVKECLVNLQDNDQQGDSQKESSSDRDYNTSRKNRRLSCSSPSTSAIEALHDDEFFVYNRPIIFGNYTFLQKIAKSSPSAQLGRLLSAGIIFNMALLLHSQARSGVKGALEKAQKLYATVVTLARDDAADSQAWSIFAFELAVVSLNNSLKASLELGDFDRAEEAAVSLQAMAALLGEPQAFLEASAWDEIVANVFTLVVSSKQHGGVPTLIPCAPAA